MNTKLTATKTIKILICLIALAILGTIGCSSSSTNPVGTDFDNPQDPTALTSFDPQLDSAEAPNADSREAQIFWFQNPELGTEPNNIPAQATTVFHAQAYNGHADSTTDVDDYYRINIAMFPASVYLYLSWTDTAWMNLYLYDEELNPVVYDNFETSGPKELFAYEIDPGVYYVRVKAFTGATDYQVRFGIGRQSYEPLNNSISTTTWNGVTVGDAYIKSVLNQTEDSADYFIVEIPEDSQAMANVDWVGPYGTDLNLTFYHPTDGVVSHSGSSACPEGLATGHVTPGTYYLRVQATSGNAIYHLKVQIVPILLPLDPKLFELYEIPDIFPPDPPWELDIPWIDDPYMFEDPGFAMPTQFMHAGPAGPQYSDDGQHDMPQMPEFGY